MSDDMIERVADAIRLRSCERGHPVHPAVVQHLAAAAIAAMPSGRDPATIEAAAKIAERAGCGNPKCRGCYGNQIAASIRALTAPARS